MHYWRNRINRFRLIKTYQSALKNIKLLGNDTNVRLGIGSGVQRWRCVASVFYILIFALAFLSLAWLSFALFSFACLYFACSILLGSLLLGSFLLGLPDLPLDGPRTIGSACYHSMLAVLHDLFWDWSEETLSFTILEKTLQLL